MPITGKPVLKAAALILLGIGLAGHSAASAQTPPVQASAVVETFDAELLEAVRNARALGPMGRYDRLMPAMAAAFDMAAMTERESSSRWRNLTPDQKKRLIAAFAAFETALYADWFDVDVGQTIDISDSHVGVDGAVTVRTVMNGGGVPALYLDYLVRADKDGRWHIVDVRYGGWLSEVEKRRDEFSNVLDHNGVESLIARLDARRQAALAHADNQTAPHLLQPRTDQWSLPVYPIN